jgi:ABC-type Fe3+/spermidine/putrescine transport system ATPase subunit
LETEVKSDVALKAVSKAFRGVPAVEDVSFEVAPESFFSLLGPSGCGKTTILRMIAGFLVPDRGDIYIRGDRVNRKPPYRRDTAMVFQNYALFPHMNVFDNVAFGLRYRGVESRDRAARVGSALEQVRLSGHELRYPSQLSGGQQQRVALARAIATQPALLLLDEPLSNLDLRLRQQMRSELRSIQREVRITTVYVTHDQAEAFSMSDKMAVMNNGRIAQIGSPDDIYFRPISDFVVTFIGETNRFLCTVVGHERGDVLVRTSNDLTFRVHVARDELSSHPEGIACELFFREEQARVVSAPGIANSFPSVVEAVQNLGSMITYTVRLLNGSKIRATTATTKANAALSVGEDVFVEVDPADCILLRKV